MIKRDITETVYEYDKEGKLVKKTVTETHEEDGNTTITWPYTTPYHPYVTCDTNDPKLVQKSLNDYLSTTDHTDATWTGGKATTTACNCACKTQE